MGIGGAGRLRERVTFSRRVDQANGYGGTVGDWQDQFTVWAGYTHLRGGETVIAARLENRHPVVIRVRQSTDTLRISADWRAADQRTGVGYAIRDVTADPGGAFIDLLCERGVPA